MRSAWASVVALALALPGGASAATINVTNNHDSGPGSLRQAIANAGPGETILVPANTYLLTSGELLVQKSLTITGAGAGHTFIDGDGRDRVFEAEGAKSRITISGLTIRDGNPAPQMGEAIGGGVADGNAILTLSHDIVDGNTADANTAGASGSGGFAVGVAYSRAGTRR